jgi:hypothetical protein
MISAIAFPLLYLAIAIITHVLLAHFTDFSPAACVGIGALVFICMPFVTYYTVRVGEIASDVFLSIRPLIISLFVPRREAEGLRRYRLQLQIELKAIVDEVFRFERPLLESLVSERGARLEKDIGSSTCFPAMNEHRITMPPPALKP